MDMGLYAQLHGLTKIARKSPTSQAEDKSDFDNAVQEYTDLIIDEEKKNFQAGVESFAEHKAKVRQQLYDTMHEFSKNYENGFKALCDALEEEGQERPVVSEEALKIFNDHTAFMKEIKEGRSIYELLGFSYETVLTFYKALNKLFEKKEYETVKDGLIFLTTISPNTVEFWVSLGMTFSKLGDYDNAIENFLYALELDPTSQDAYLGCIHAYVQTNNVDEADKLCDHGIELAKVNTDQVWAGDLETVLTNVKTVIKTNFSGS